MTMRIKVTNPNSTAAMTAKIGEAGLTIVNDFRVVLVAR